MAFESADSDRLREELTGLRSTVAAREAALAERDRTIEEKVRTISAKDAAIAELDSTIGDLSKRLQLTTAERDWLRKRLFGRSTEKVIDGAMLFGDLAPAEAPATPAETAPDDEGSTVTQQERRKAARKASRSAEYPEHWPRRRVEIPLPESQWTCCACGDARHKIGEDVTEIVHRTTTYEVEQQVRGRYACRCGEGGVVTPELAPRAIPGSYAGPSLLAFVLVGKYVTHLPLYRMSAMFRRDGLDVARSTLCDWVAAVMPLLEPVARAIRAKVLEMSYVQADETPVTVADGEDGRAQTGYVWVYRAPSSPGREVFYDFRMGRSGNAPLEVLSAFSGTLQADAYAGYNAVVLARDLVRAGCLAHARRKFHDALETAPRQTGMVITLFRRLYAIEAEARAAAMDAPQRLALRTQKSVPVLTDLHATVRTLATTATPQSALGKACAYTLAEWECLTVFSRDGEVEIDNNGVENALRGVALGRRNWLFCGTEEGGRRAAVIYTIVESCRAVGADPLAYLTDVLTRLPAATESQLPGFLPAAWAAERAKMSPPAAASGTSSPRPARPAPPAPPGASAIRPPDPPTGQDSPAPPGRAAAPPSA